MAAQEWARETARALSALDAESRSFLHRLYFEGATQDSIAATDNLPVATVRRVVARALQRVAAGYSDAVRPTPPAGPAESAALGPGVRRGGFG